MECKDYREQFTSILTDSADQTERKNFEDHIAACAECREQFEEAARIWTLMGEMSQPEPSASMKEGFNIMMANHKKELYERKKPLSELFSKFRNYWSLQAQPRLAFSLLLVAIGLIGGYLLHQPGQSALSYNKQIDSLSSQVSQMKQVMMLTLLGDPSASERIRAVAYTDEINKVDMKVITALFTTLNEDPNVNVRLATLEALVKLASEPKVREGLVRSIDMQDSPLMQTAIADAMVKLQEKSSVQNLQKLLTKKGLNNMVKVNIEKSIQKLI